MNVLNLPRHIAIIMDGNGRWAKDHGLPRYEGHRKGVEAAEEVITTVREWNIPYLTLYAFSEENWKRPPEEVQALMGLLKHFLLSKQQKMINHGIRFETIGDCTKLPREIQETISQTKAITQEGRQLTLILALSYGARDEIVRAVRNLLTNQELTEELFANHLDTKNFPDPDLLIRTGGEYRLSNYLLWQLAYTELYFTKTQWPDFTPLELEKALKEFAQRERRFGKTSEQL